LHGLTDHQLQQFQTFYEQLMQHNELFNLTTITSLKGCIAYHFNDSLMLKNLVDVASRRGIVDVGTGGGFPGIPLAIMYPEMPIYLIEVTKKKIEFLDHMIALLGLTNCEVFPMDWRTFLRKTELEVDLFCARASLHPVELLRLLQPGCFYNASQLVYWASETWEPEPKEISFIKQTYCYTLNRKHRKLVLFEKPKTTE
jgi:16S rRNA (guanine(527)-N(7))-methyltransferase RsmG